MKPTTGNTDRARQAIKDHKNGKGKPKGHKNGFFPAKARDKKMAKRERLPHGSSYICRYDAANQLWSVTLAVNTGSGERTFSHQFGALFQCLEAVDKMYRVAAEKEGGGQ